MCTDGKCGRVTIKDDDLCFTGAEYAAMAVGAMGTAGSVANANQTNNANQAIAGTNTAANAYMQVQNQGYNAEQAGIARDFNSLEAQKARQFQSDTNTINRDNTWAMYNDQKGYNTAEAQKNRDYQTEMSNTQYQRAIGDLKAAGLNPMLAYKNGGAGTPTGGSASTSASAAQGSGGPSASGPAASSGGWAGPGQWTAQQAQIGPAISSALSGLEMTKKMDVYDAQIRNTNADTAVKESLAPQNVAQTIKIEQEVKNLQEDLKFTIDKAANTRMNTEQQGHLIHLQEAQRQLAKIQTSLAANTITYQDAQKALVNAQRVITEAQQSGEKNAEAFANTWWGRNVSPALGDAASVLNSAGRIGQMFRGGGSVAPPRNRNYSDTFYDKGGNVSGGRSRNYQGD